MLQKMATQTLGLNAEGLRQPQIIAVTSGKGGVGKSTMSVNMGLMMQRLNRKVLVVDADIHLGNVDFILGIRPEYTIADVVRGTIGVEEALVALNGGIDILPAAGAAPELLEAGDGVLQKLARSFKGLENRYDVIIFDTGAGISQLVLNFVLGCDKTVLLVTPDPASLADAYAVIKVVRGHNRRMPIIMTANMVRSHEEGDVLYKKMNLMVNRFLGGHIDFGGAILRDDMVSTSIKQQRPFVMDHPNSSTTKALRMINQRILKMPNDKTNEGMPFFERFILNRKKMAGDNL